MAVCDDRAQRRHSAPLGGRKEASSEVKRYPEDLDHVVGASSWTAFLTDLNASAFAMRSGNSGRRKSASRAPNAASPPGHENWPISGTRENAPYRTLCGRKKNQRQSNEAAAPFHHILAPRRSADKPQSAIRGPIASSVAFGFWSASSFIFAFERSASLRSASRTISGLQVAPTPHARS